MKIRLTLAVLSTLFLTCVFYACRKDLSGKSAKLTAASITDPAVPLDIGLAKKYYHNLRKEQGDAVPATAAAISAGHPKNRKYVLFKAAYRSETPSYTFVEAPLFFNQKPTTVIKPAGQTADIKADLPVIQGNLSRLVIYKSKRTGQVDQRILTYIPDVSYLARHHNDISRNHVNALDSDYNGYIKYQNWAGKTLFLLKIKNGRSVKRYSSAYSSVKNKKVSTSAIICEDLVDISYIETCYYADPEGLTEYCVDSDFQFYYHTDCYDDGTGDPDCFETGDCYDPGCNSCDPPSDPPPPDPCGIAKALAASANYTNKLTDLNGLKNGDFERSWFDLYNYTAQDFQYFSQDGAAGDYSADMSFPTGAGVKIKDYMHVHPVGALPNFSADDLKGIYNMYHGSLIDNVNTFSATVVTQNGTYSLIISNPSTFNTFGSNYMDGSSPLWTAFVAGYNNAVKSTNTAAQNEVGMLNVLKNFSSGLTLMKMNANGSFSQLGLTNNDSEVSVTGCN